MDKSVSIRPYTIVGSTESKDAFSRVFLYQPIEEGVLTTRGELFVIFSAAVPGLEIDWEKVAIQSFNFLRDTYYRSVSGGVLQTLEESLEKTREEFKRLIAEYIPQGQFPTIDLHLGALVIWGGTYLFRSSGKVFFALYRNNELVDYSQDRFVQEAIAENDALVLGTAVFGERVGTSVLKKVLESELSDDWQRLIRQEVQDVEQNALLSGIILSVLIEAQAGEEEVIEIIMPGMPNKSSKKNPLAKLPKPARLPSIAIPKISLLSRISNVVDKAKSKLSRDEIYVKKTGAPKSLKKWLLVVVFVILLGGSIYYTSQKNKIVEQEQQHQALQDGVRDQLLEIQEIAQNDRQQAKRALDALENELGSVQGATTAIESEEFTHAFNAVHTVEQTQWNTYPLNVSAQSLSVTSQSDQAIVVSSQTGEMFTVQQSGITGSYENDSFKGMTDLVAVENGYYVYHPESGLWYLASPGSEVTKIIEQNGQWGTLADIAVYVDNVYILAPQIEQLSKYIGLGSGQLGGATGYFVEPVQYDTALDIAIDGFVYVLHTSNKIEKFLGGKRTEFSLSGIYPTNVVANSIETQVGYSYVYIGTDKGVMVIDTNGVYQKLLQTSSPVKDLAVTENEDTIYVITDEGLLSAPLNLPQ